jgi:hypothetical protein
VLVTTVRPVIVRGNPFCGWFCSLPPVRARRRCIDISRPPVGESSRRPDPPRAHPNG